ncbi:MAG: heparinase II/III family protein [Saprospiraceae bacterium]
MSQFIRYFTYLLVCTLVFCWSTDGAAQEKRSLLTGKYSQEQLRGWLDQSFDWVPYPVFGEGWDQLSTSIKTAQIGMAEAQLGQPIPPLTASLLLEFSINGNRSNHGDLYFGRRNRLAQAVIAECMERKGRFMGEIIDLVWAICEESFWVIPAHYGTYGEAGLPAIDAAYVDLFAAETGALLAWTYYLLEKELDKVSSVLNKRILAEVDKRVLKPNLAYDDFWWMGISGRTLNNWTPWICSNWLACVLLCEKDAAKKAEAAYKIMACIDRFLDPYPADGGCDEGPGYWGRAGASLYDCLDLFELATKGKVNIWDAPLVRNIGQYIYKAHIKDDYYINFADAAAITKPSAPLVFAYGEKIKDEQMMAFGAWLAQRQQIFEGKIGDNLPRKLAAFQVLSALEKTKPQEAFVGESWFPDLQVLACHSDESNGDGFFMAAKGGHNAESHNHNDIGNFIIYHNGKPLIIDIGVETYTKKTFSDQRYEIWTMQSQYHNVPTVNGQMQSPGRSFEARHTARQNSDQQISFSMDIAAAYPAESGLEKWERTLTFQKNKQEISLKDVYQLKETKVPNVLHLMAANRPTIDEKTQTILLGAEVRGKAPVTLKYPKNFMATFEEIPLTDSRLQSTWGEKLFRIQLTDTQKKVSGTYHLTFTTNP